MIEALLLPFAVAAAIYAVVVVGALIWLCVGIVVHSLVMMIINTGRALTAAVRWLR